MANPSHTTVNRWNHEWKHNCGTFCGSLMEESPKGNFVRADGPSPYEGRSGSWMT